MALACLRVFVCICVLLAGACSTISPEERVSSFDEAVRLYDAGEFEAAYRLFDKLSYVDAAAARNAGLMLRKGQGVDKDPAAAKRMFAFASQAGMATAAADLGEMLLKGEGAPPNPAAALPWLTLAASAHHAIAEYNLATMYEAGNGVPRDVARARDLYAEAAKAGYADAQARLEALGGEPPPLRSSTDDAEPHPDKSGKSNVLEGPTRESGPDSPPPEAPVPDEPPQLAPPQAPSLPGVLPPVAPMSEPLPPAPAGPAGPDDYEDISKPDFSTPDDAFAPKDDLPQAVLPDLGPDLPELPGTEAPAP